jgi:hypothetical protein
LSKLGKFEYSPNLKRYIWTFPIINIREVLAVLGRPVQFDAEEGELAKAYSRNSKKEIKQGPAQGTGFINVALHPTKPNYFVVTTVRERQPQNTNVSFDTVSALWRVIKKQPLNKKILTATVACNYCAELGIDGFNTYKDDRFNWKYFSGSRKHYLTFYAAVKVLVHYKVIEHIVQASKSGIKRVEDSWSIQTELI